MTGIDNECICWDLLGFPGTMFQGRAQATPICKQHVAVLRPLVPFAVARGGRGGGGKKIEGMVLWSTCHTFLLRTCSPLVSAFRFATTSASVAAVMLLSVVYQFKA